MHRHELVEASGPQPSGRGLPPRAWDLESAAKVLGARPYAEGLCHHEHIALQLMSIGLPLVRDDVSEQPLASDQSKCSAARGAGEKKKDKVPHVPVQGECPIVTVT